MPEVTQKPAQNEIPAEAGSVLEVIEAGRWKSALLTSFTLSLTYVESHLLPALRRSGCESLTILADTAGYRDSLVEQRSLGVGRDYTVLPVRVKGGIFHPKLVYLEAQESAGDTLLVGSGNVTYPGGGGNLEVMEILTAAECARAFRECADFLEQLGASPRVQLPASEELKALIARMRAVAQAGADVQEVEFIHSLNKSGIEQLLEAAKRAGEPWHELLVLSPYHHPSADPVLALVEGLGVSRLLVGVPGREDEPSAFPFAEARRRFPEVRVVAPVPESKPDRALHAKWFEVRGPAKSLVFTGSFNATNASFAGVDNVECGVLRTQPAASSCWTPTSERAFRKSEFPRRGDVQAPCVYAVLTDRHTLQGTLLGQVNSLPWKLVLESADEVLLAADVDLNEEGQFSVALPPSLDPSDVGTIQVRLLQGAVRASGWVQITQMLRLDSRHRRILDIVRRANSGTQTEDDWYELLDIVNQHLGGVVATAAALRASHPASRKTPSEQVLPAVDLTTFRPDATSAGGEHAALVTALNGGETGLQFLERLFSSMRPKRREPTDEHPPERLGRNPYQSDSHDSGAGQSGAADEEESKDESARAQERRSKAKRHLGACYEVIRKKLHDARAELQRNPENASSFGLMQNQLLSVWLQISLRLEPTDFGDAGAPHSLLGGLWLREVATARLPSAERKTLAQDVCGVAAAHALALASLSASTPKSLVSTGPSAALQAMDPLRELVRRVHAFFGDPLDVPAVIQAARNWLSSEEAVNLVAHRVDEALEALQDTLSTPTEKQVLASILRDGVQKEAVELAKYSPEVSKLFRDIAACAEHTPAKVCLVDPAQLDRCPNSYCHQQIVEYAHGLRSLKSEVSWRLNKLGAYRCICGYYLVAREGA